MSERTTCRRRFLSIAAGGLALGAGWGLARRRAQGEVHRFDFVALGAAAALSLPGERAAAEAAYAAIRAEVEGIEAAASLWRADSALARLNRTGRADAPGAHFARLAMHADEMFRLSEGGFDPTVQPLWRAYAAGGDAAAAARRVGWGGLRLSAEAVWFERPGMAATFNGVAQGYAADAAIETLRRRGYADALAHLGEHRAIGARPDGTPWRIGVADPVDARVRAVLRPGAAHGGAVATSAPRGTLVRGRPHIFDPLGRAGARWASVTVVAEQAWRADALSTAVAAAPVGEAEALLRRGGADEAILIAEDGALSRWRG